ncbi:hypothetical protein PPERSA_06564 [Pseudocohnilembus persalinus]|uniref:Uncharacterized protein n=1 Tax=Pseudocohnilembus persalinus TaxID=266149 RepID=A0A0V0QRJ3_PSEPJ|nr:hypothetical protein PPERSA_06564 [Pseudocohnilembus persalinus]|eukprot:KRX04930.1 hypothetical protein PPERSA_06564 [Pseudocohnilembus persalinus]
MQQSYQSLKPQINQVKMQLISQAKQVDQLQKKYEKNEKAQPQVKTNLSEQLQIKMQKLLSQKNQINKQHLKQKQKSHTRNQTQFTNPLKKQTEESKITWSQKKNQNSVSSLHSISNNNSQLSKNVQNSQNSSQNENKKQQSQQYQYNNQFQLRSINSLSTQTETQSYRSYNPEGQQSSNRNIDNNINNIYFGNENNSPNFCNSARGKPEQQQQNFSQSLNLYKQNDLQEGKKNIHYNNNNGKQMSKLTNLQMSSFEFKKGSKIYDILFQDNSQKITQKSDYKNQNQKIIESEYIKNHLQKTENFLQQQQCRKENQKKFEQDKILQQNLQQISFIPINDDQKQTEQQQKPHNMNQNNDNQIYKIKNLQNDHKIKQNNDEQKQQQLISNRSNVYKQVAFQLNEQNDTDQYIKNVDKNCQAILKNQDLQQQQNEQKKQEYINLCTISNTQLQNMSNQEIQQKFERLQYLKSIFKSLDQDLNTKDFNQNGLEDLRKNSENRYNIYEKMESQRNTQIQQVKNQFKQFRKNQEQKRANYQAQSFQNSNFNDNKKQSQNLENEKQNQEFQNNLSLYNINKQKCQQDIKNAYKSIKQDIKSRELVI